MNLFQFMILCSLLVTAIIGAFVLAAQPKRLNNQAFLFLSGSLIVWQGVLFGASFARAPADLDFWIRQSSAVAALIPPGMNLLRLSILRSTQTFFGLLQKNLRWFLLWVLVAFLCQSPPFLRSVTSPAAGQMVAQPQYGWGFLIYSLYFLGAWVVLFRRMLVSKRKVSGLKQSEIEYLLLSCAISLFVGVLFLIVPIATGWTDLGAGLPVSVILFTGITAYGIATRGILDVPVVARRIVAWSMLIVTLFSLYAGVLFGMRALLPLTGIPGEPLASLLAISAVVFTLTPAQGLLQRLTDRLFVSTPPLDVGAALSSASRRLQTLQTPDELYHQFAALLSENLDAPEVRIFLLEEQQFVQVYPQRNGAAFARQHGIPRLLEDQCQAVVQELMERVRFHNGDSSLRVQMAEDGISAAIGLYQQETLTGFFLLGPRASGRIYGQIECNILEGLRDLFGVVHENTLLYEKIRRTERLASIGTLAAGMAHEIKNPLVTLKTFTQLVPERYDDPEFRDAFSKLVGKEIDRIDTLVNQLLHFSRPIKPNLQPIALQDLLREEVEAFSEQARQDRIVLTTAFTATRDRIRGDVHLLQQVFLNLFLNARDAMKGGGTLSISCQDNPEGPAVEVADTGEGIAPAMVPHIFDPFYTTKNEGTGLGLAVAHRILEEHHVQITVRSTPGGGTAFRLLFPRMKEAGS